MIRYRTNERISVVDVINGVNSSAKCRILCSFVLNVKSRQSNIELLRIIAMLFIVIVHCDGAALGLPNPTKGIAGVGDWWKISVEALVIVGVNCFTLISGFFGIKAKLRGFLRFVLTCIFYSVGAYVLFAAFGKIEWSATGFVGSLMVLTHTDLWYVPAYAGLYLLSPFINAATQGLDKRRFKYALIALIAFNVWCGWLWHGSFNPTGYTIVQLVVMYAIGRYIGQYVDFGDICHRQLVRVWSIAVYVIATMTTIAFALFMPSTMAFAYNSPAVMVASVALLLFFASCNIQSRAINSIAMAAFAVYLIHKNPYVWVVLMRPTCVSMWKQLSIGGYAIFVFAFACAIYAASWCIDRLRGMLFRQCETLLDNKIKI